MPFKRSTYEEHPVGATIGTLVDYKDETEGEFGPQTRLSFDSEELMEDGRPFRVSYWIRDSINPKSNAYKFLVAMGLDPDKMSDEELERLDIHDLLGRKCQLVVEHVKKKDGAVRAKVTNLLPLAKRRAAKAEPARELVAAGAAKSELFADDDE